MVVRLYEAPDMHVRLPDGREALFSPGGAPIRDESGQVIGAVCALHEVTNQRRIEREAAQRLREIETVFESMTDLAIVYDADGNLRRINQSARKVLSLDMDPDHFNHPIAERSQRFEVRDEHGQPLPPKAWPHHRMLRGERLEGASAADTTVRTLDGRDVHLNTTGAPLRDEQGRITGAVLIARDVSGRRALEHRSRDALEALLAMAEALMAAPSDEHADAADGSTSEPLILTADAAHRLAELTCRVLGCTRASISLLDLDTGATRPLAVTGLTPEQERLWMRMTAETQPEDYFDAAQLAELMAGQPVILDLDRARERGSSTYDTLRTLVVPMRVAGQVIGSISAGYGPEPHKYTPDEIALGEAIGHLCSLMVERERLLREHAASEARALALESTKRRMDEFLGVVSHELRTPLTSIKANIQVARRRLHGALYAGEIAPTEQTRTLPDLLVRAERQVTRLDTLVSDLLDVSRIQSGKLQLRPAAHNLLDIVTEAVQDERLAWPGRDISLANSEREPWPVYADADRIRQVVTNYLTNALKYAPRERPIIVGVAEAGRGDARVSVRDHGPGVLETEREAIWELFHQATGTQHLNGSGVGLGLGLHICKTIVERHSGHVGVDSPPGQGATFWFTLPLARAT
jgi:signal transduction histidine kinase/PAS domain-containing protein